MRGNPDHPARDVGVVSGADPAPGAVVHAGIIRTGAHLVFADPSFRGDPDASCLLAVAASPAAAPLRRPRPARCPACEEGL
jgi:hypothetical protein